LIISGKAAKGKIMRAHIENGKTRPVIQLFISVFLLVVSATMSHATVLVATGPGEGHSPLVRVTVDGPNGNDTISFMAYQKNFVGGVRVAVGDFNGDGFDDVITGAGVGGSGHVKVFDGRRLGRTNALLMSFDAYPGSFRGGVYVAAGDVTGDGRADIIVAPDAGGQPLVRVFDGKTGAIITSFLAYSPTYTGGVSVSAGDVNGDGRIDIITGAQVNGHVKVFDGKSGAQLQSFLAFPGFSGGVSVAAGDLNSDRHADLIVGAGPGAPGGHVKVFDGQTGQELLSFFAFDPNFLGGVRVAAGDVDSDKIPDIIVGAGPGGGPHVKVFRAIDQLVLHNFLAYEPDFLGGVFVAGA
jgi:fibronectin-binding autotransporter adhesin